MKEERKFDPEVIEFITQSTRSERLHLFEQSFPYYCLYYFPEFFTYPLAGFHWDFFDDCEKLASGELEEAAWIAFRESAKSTIAKAFICWLICYKKKRYINWDSYDKANAEQALFDVAGFLRTNANLLRDFGNLYKKKKKKNPEETDIDDPQMKRIGSFITENGVKVEAFSTQESTRGRSFAFRGKIYRPDQYINDDIETSKTKDSLPVTEKIIEHIDEARSGTGVTASTLYLGNYITEEGVIAHIMERLKDREGKVIRMIPVVYPDGSIAWPGKYVMTKQEAFEKNQGKPRDEWVVAIEKKREDLGDSVFETEMMNNPGKSGDYFFDREKVRKALEKAQEPKRDIAGLKIWADFNAKHRYGGGADTSEGIGGDSSTTAIFDFTQTPNLVVATYKNNQIPPNTFAYEIRRHSDAFGACFFVPEINNTGYATVAELINIGFYNMYKREVKNKTSGKLQKEYGWRTTVGTKYEIFSQFKTAFEDGEIEILDKDLLNEMYHYTKTVLRRTATQDSGMTRHFDLLMAAVLAWEARNYALLSSTDLKERRKAPKREPYVV